MQWLFLLLELKVEAKNIRNHLRGLGVMPVAHFYRMETPDPKNALDWRKLESCTEEIAVKSRQVEIARVVLVGRGMQPITFEILGLGLGVVTVKRTHRKRRREFHRDF